MFLNILQQKKDQASLDIILKKISNICMRDTLRLLILFYILASCQEAPKKNVLKNDALPDSYQAQIKLEKKRQAELDIPFRGFEQGKVISTITFSLPTENCWTQIESIKPDLMILMDTPDKNIKMATDFRSVREKIPFMCTPSVDNKTNYLKDWPYAKDIIPETQDGTYHSKIFGSKKNLLQVFVDDPVDSEKKWKWLESELSKDSALKIMTGQLKYRDRLYKIVKKLKIKNLIVLPSDGEITGLVKIKELNNVYEAQTRDRSPSNENKSVGLIKINWSKRNLQFKVTTSQNDKNQVVDINF